MRRSLWGRVIAVAYALWFVVVLSEPAALHECAMHDGAIGGEHSHEAPRADHHHGGTPSSGDHDKTPPCSCVAACCSAPLAVAPLCVADFSFVAVTAFGHVPIAARTDHRPVTVAYARPPAIGPPRHPA
ncbi:MAG: hypothetical protein ABI664_02060 [bacterium]